MSRPSRFSRRLSVVHHDDFTPAQRRADEAVRWSTGRLQGPVRGASRNPTNHTEKISLGQTPAWGSASIPHRQVAEIRGKNATRRQAVRQCKTKPPACGDEELARAQPIDNLPGHPLRAQPAGWADALPRRRPNRNRFQGCRARHAPVALTRKKALFARQRRAENSAMLASLIETCKLQRVNPGIRSVPNRHSKQACQQLTQ